MQSDSAFPSPTIHRLSEVLINQIAAGEVVERPSSVVKELVENSLDARADRVEISLYGGGIDEILIIDNGCGMAASDLKLCLERHTTSKLGRLGDLETLGTYGFRGEALSSIASVAEVQIKSRTPSMPKANALSYSFGKQAGELAPAAGPLGTSVTVKRLFQTIPVRQKFLRSPATEFSHCSKVVKELALGNPGTAFTLRHEERLVQALRPTTREARFIECFRPSWKPLSISETHEGIRLEAFLSPAHVVQDRGDLLIFINGRPIRSKAISACLRRGYLDTLGSHHEPSGICYLDIRPDWVDVNVHPQKLEVRLIRQDSLFHWILAAVRKALGKAATTREPSSWREKEGEPRLEHDGLKRAQSLFTYAEQQVAPRDDVAKEPSFSYSSLSSVVSLPPPLRYLGQTRACYLVCEDSEGLVLADQHALNERQLFNSLKATHQNGGVDARSLSVPRVLRPPRDLIPIAEAYLPLFRELGIDMESFGDGDLAIKSCPPTLQESQLEGVLMAALTGIRDLIDHSRIEAVAGMSCPGFDPALDPILASLACHSAVRSNQVLSTAEAEKLISTVDRMYEAWTCPHGRPVFLRIQRETIERHFERR